MCERSEVCDAKRMCNFATPPFCTNVTYIVSHDVDTCKVAKKVCAWTLVCFTG